MRALLRYNKTSRGYQTVKHIYPRIDRLFLGVQHLDAHRAAKALYQQLLRTVTVDFRKLRETRHFVSDIFRKAVYQALGGAVVFVVKLRQYINVS